MGEFAWALLGRWSIVLRALVKARICVHSALSLMSNRDLFDRSAGHIWNFSGGDGRRITLLTCAERFLLLKQHVASLQSWTCMSTLLILTSGAVERTIVDVYQIGFDLVNFVFATRTWMFLPKSNTILVLVKEVIWVKTFSRWSVASRFILIDTASLIATVLEFNHTSRLRIYDVCTR